MISRQNIIKKRWLILLIVILVLLIGCEKRAWEKAEAENTIPAYEGFIKKYPQGTYATNAFQKIEEIYFKKAQAINSFSTWEDFLKSYPNGHFADETNKAIENLYNGRDPAFKQTRRVKLIIKETYGSAEDVNLPFRNVAADFCNYAGLNIIRYQDKNYDVILRIEVVGRALSNNYLDLNDYNTFGNCHYSGALLEGTITLEIPDSIIKMKTFRGERKPPRQIVQRYPSPSSAPFREALAHSEFHNILFDIIGKTYGHHFYFSALKDKGMSSRAREELIKIGKPMVNLLIASLRNENTRVRKEAVLALSKIKDERVIEPLIEAVKDEHWEVRNTTVIALSKIKDKRVIEPLIASLNDENWEVRSTAVFACSEIKDKRTIKPLISLLKDMELNIDPAEALVKIGEPAVEPLIHALQDKNIGIKSGAASTLGMIKDKRAIEPLSKLLNDDSPRVRGNALMALVNIQEKAAIKNLIIALNDNDYFVKTQAACRLWDMKQEDRFIKIIIDSLKVEDLYVREIAGMKLVEIGKPAIKYLIIALEDKDFMVQEKVEQVLYEITGLNFGENHDEWIKWWQEKRDKYLEQQKEQ